MDQSIAVIGHVDHGKTTLVKALTGVDTDTLEDERRRGLSIALGFASYRTSHGVLHFIDAPGHIDFIRTTAAGLSGVRAVLLVVSSQDGIGAQTIEHLKLARLFGVTQSIVALSKADLVTELELNQLRRDVEVLLHSAGLFEAVVLPTSTRTEAGLEALKNALETLAVAAHADLPGFFLPIDRVFSVSGAGTVVTGTLLGAPLRSEQDATIFPNAQSCRVRGLEVSGSEVDRAKPGTRVAVNLRGINQAQLQKGDVLCAKGVFTESQCFDVALDAVSGATKPLKHMEDVQVLCGTRHAAARVRLLTNTDEAGSCLAQLEFKRPQIAFAGQRVIVRRPSTHEIVTGGTVLDPSSIRVARHKEAHVAVLRAAETGDLQCIAHALADRDRGIVDLQRLAVLARADIPQIGRALETEFALLNADTMVRSDDLAALSERILDALAKLHADRPIRPMIPISEVGGNFRNKPDLLFDRAIHELAHSNRIIRNGPSIALRDHSPDKTMSEGQRGIIKDADRRLLAMGVRPAALFDAATKPYIAEDVAEFLVWNKKAIPLHNHALKQSFLLHQQVYEDALKTLHAAFPEEQEFTTSAARIALNTNRKTIVPLLEHLDAQGITERRGDKRRLSRAAFKDA